MLHGRLLGWGANLEKDGSVPGLHAQQHMPAQGGVLRLELLPALLGRDAGQELGGQVGRVPAQPTSPCTVPRREIALHARCSCRRAGLKVGRGGQQPLTIGTLCCPASVTLRSAASASRGVAPHCVVGALRKMLIHRTQCCEELCAGCVSQ